MKYDNNNLHISIVAFEKEPNTLKIDKNSKLEDIWCDDSVEFFLFTTANNTLRHGIFSTANRYIVQTITPKKQTWGSWDKLKYTMTNKANQRNSEITIPMDKEMKKEFRFNLVRSRKVKNLLKDEPYTWSDSEGIGNCFVTNSYGKITLK